MAAGSSWFNSVNADNGGCLVDGIMSPQEMGLEKDPYRWSLLVGPHGGWANVLLIRTASIQDKMKLFYLDDRCSKICQLGK